MAEGLTNPFDLPGQWYKANLHAHTTMSDGHASPAERVRQYERAGYHVLALTDHNVTTDIEGLGAKGLLLIRSIELNPACPTAAQAHHVVGLNVPRGYVPARPKDAKACVREIAKAGGLTILAHPYWLGHEPADLRSLPGVAALEVYNATCGRIGRACSENEWAHVLDRGWMLPAVAVDDCHRDDDALEGWTWLRLRRLSVAEVLRAVRTGAGYASCGPTIHDVRVTADAVKLRCSPAAEIHFMGQAPRGARRRAEPGHTVRTFSIERPAWNYVRAVVTDAAGRKAWTNPLPL